MVNCVTCQKSFKIRIGKNKSTRCESCASVWRQKQLLEEESNQLRDERTNELRLKQLSLQEKQLELEKQKITIKEMLPQTGNTIELTCYYDQNSRNKVAELLAGTRRVIPKPPPLPPTPDSISSPRRRSLPRIPVSDARPRKLPNIEGLLHRRIQRRFKLEEEGSTSANTSGMSVD